LKTADRADCVGKFRGQNHIIDFKTSSKPKKKEWIDNDIMQGSAYAVMWEEMTKIPIAYIAIIIAVADDQTIDTSSGNLVLDAATNRVKINAATDITGDTVITGILSVTNDITAFYSSDARLKDDITPIEDPLNKVQSLSGNTYTWNEKSNKEGEDVGVIAQEVQEVLPEAVTVRGDGYLAVDYHKIIPLLVEAVKELTEKVATLEGDK